MALTDYTEGRDELKIQVNHHIVEIARWTETLNDEALNKHVSKRVLKEALRNIEKHHIYITRLVM